ncbi:uncharacterized protein LOC112348574 [Selaginella moellendorffii]|uniref:uncharacterized protein LOC112348574 n=1 Tax=Selaginella moellendorffii TaxID=88036 RepID=UPI000D1CE1BE|nr:uncharacterized protein LOC112348574 [Selaginella moellendorffii]|eukprot:XP_024537165.1 uncharacterized protein LOC112348574 [Selaginella moellendorffii]
MFADGFQERHDLEQYFWTEATVKRLTQALEGIKEGEICCLTTPSLAHAFYFQHQRTELLLDVDTRFRYLPGFRYFDLRMPASLGSERDHPMSVIVFDPPFFYIPLEVLFEAVTSITKNRANCKLVLGFLRREEAALLRVFKSFGLKPTKFVLEYATVKPNKWRNYTLYSNVDLPCIKRITKP